MAENMVLLIATYVRVPIRFPLPSFAPGLRDAPQTHPHHGLTLPGTSPCETSPTPCRPGLLYQKCLDQLVGGFGSSRVCMRCTYCTSCRLAAASCARTMMSTILPLWGDDLSSEGNLTRNIAILRNAQISYRPCATKPDCLIRSPVTGYRSSTASTFIYVPFE